MMQHTKRARFWRPPNAHVAVRWPRAYLAPITRFEKIWIEQCRATRAIKRRFGAKDALDYLVGEKLRMFADAARHDGAFARELPRFLAEYPFPPNRLVAATVREDTASEAASFPSMTMTTHSDDLVGVVQFTRPS